MDEKYFPTRILGFIVEKIFPIIFLFGVGICGIWAGWGFLSWIRSDSSSRMVQISRLKAAEQQNRFLVESYGAIHAGYGDHMREILIITDSKTGKQYLTVTGCGTTELWTETHVNGKTITTSTVEE